MKPLSQICLPLARSGVWGELPPGLGRVGAGPCQRHAGPWGDNSFIEDYTAEVRGRPLGCFHLVTFNADGQTQHVAAHYRPLSSLMFFSRLLRETFAGTPYAERFLAGEA